MFFTFTVSNIGRHASIKKANIQMLLIGKYNNKPIYKGKHNGRDVFFAYVINYGKGQWQLVFGDPREEYTTTKILHIINSENLEIIDGEYHAYVEFGGELVVTILHS
jgi:hypothetical protein